MARNDAPGCLPRPRRHPKLIVATVTMAGPRSRRPFAVAMGTEPVLLLAETVLLSAAPLTEYGWLQPNTCGLGARQLSRPVIGWSRGNVDDPLRLR